MENNIDNADKFLLKRNDIIGETSYSERMFWAELLVEYGKLLQADDVIGSFPISECQHRFDGEDNYKICGLCGAENRQ